MTDDGYINIRVVEQLLAGNGPVFNAGERVEVTTSTLWLYLIALPSAVLPVEPSVIAVVLGWLFSILAVVFATVGARRLAIASGWARAKGLDVSIPLPAGLLVLVGITQFTEFATSGLEGGLTLCYLAACFYGLTLHLDGERAPHRPLWLPVVIGLGWLVRPDAALYSAVFGVVLLLISRRTWRSAGLTAVLVGTLPMAYQIFRMGYYATLVPNTALAKNAGDSLWSFGVNYVLVFLRHYALIAAIIPLAVLLVALIVKTSREAKWRPLLVTLACVGAGAIHLAYIVKVGGDFMFGRFLLAPMFAMILPLTVVSVRPDALRRGVGACLSVLLVWALHAGATMQPQRFHGHGVQDEYFIYTGWTPSGTTLRPWDWAGFDFYEHGFGYAREHAQGARYFQEADGRRMPVAPGYDLVITHNVMGIVSVVAGTDVMIIDNLALTDPVAARVDVTATPERVGHMGHPEEYRIARYAAPSSDDSPEVVSAREVLACEPVARLTRGISDPLTPSLFWSNVVDSPRLTRLRIDETPSEAKEALCPSPGPSTSGSSVAGTAADEEHEPRREQPRR